MNTIGIVDVAPLAAAAYAMLPGATITETSLHEFRGERGEAIIAAVRRAVFDDHVAAFNEARIPEPLHKSFGQTGSTAGSGAEPTDDRQFGLRARDQRRRDRQPAKASDELPPTRENCHLVPPKPKASHDGADDSTGTSHRL
jgi:hypothetical protein